MPGSVSPLEVIKQRELALRQQVDAAKRSGEERIQAARVEAGQRIRQADQGGKAAAETYYRQGIEQANQEAKAIITAADKEATALRRQAMSRLDEVARQIVERVYAPSNGENPGYRHKAMPG